MPHARRDRTHGEGRSRRRYGLALHPDKTRLVAFARPGASQRGGKGPSTFDFLGFMFY
jgi:hypothetical protein